MTDRQNGRIHWLTNEHLLGRFVLIREMWSPYQWMLSKLFVWNSADAAVCRWIQLDSEYHPLALQYLLNLPVKINTQMGSNPFVFSVSMIILAAIALEIRKLVQNGISSSLLVKSSAQTGSQAAATAIPPGGCLVCHLVDGTSRGHKRSSASIEEENPWIGEQSLSLFHTRREV